MKLAIIHFNPIDLYPPTMNWLNYLAPHANDNKLEVYVFTRKAPENIPVYYPQNSLIKIFRSNNSDKKKPLFRYISYAHYYLFVIKKLVSWQPDTVLYYESLSALPAIIYKKIFRKNCRLLVHYHEYTSPEEYKNEMILNRWWHLLEKKNYPFYNWISHTNEDRMRFFLEDNKQINIPGTHVLPNYPPGSWQHHNKPEKDFPFKFVYVGALSLETMYVTEFSVWIIAQQGNATWDIYSNNITEETENYFSSLQNENIQLHKGVNYYSLPAILKDYNAGIILYKGHIPNYVYNAPNKLFEYYACGLDVWFPDSMISSLKYVTVKSYPKIIAVNFKKLNETSLESKISNYNFMYKPSVYYSEEQFNYFIQKGLHLKKTEILQKQ